jgi:NADH-quinone oxidoreductase E subunit
MPIEFNEAAKREFDALVARYPDRQAALLMVLHLAQDEFGCLDLEVQSLVADRLRVPKVLVREVTTFYEMFHEHKEGQFHLEVCTNIACHLAGADRLVSCVKKKLGVEVGFKTEDGLFSLMEAECLASCGSAPVMKVGLDYYEYLTEDAALSLIQTLKELAPKLGGRAYKYAESGPHVGPVRGFEPVAPVAPSEPVETL